VVCEDFIFPLIVTIAEPVCWPGFLTTRKSGNGFFSAAAIEV
jgi:hypothetical protein